MSMRAQVSLLFDDKDLFENFIEPYKQERLLNGLIVRCLSAYYYNEDVRTLIEGTAIDDVVEATNVPTTQELCDSIRTALLMQDFLAAELEQAIDTGTEDINNILSQTNDFAKESGVAASRQSEYGGNMLQIEMKNLNTPNNQTSQQQSMGFTLDNPLVQFMMNTLGKLAQGQGNAEVIEDISKISGNGIPVAMSVMTETQRQTEVPQVQMEAPKEEVISHPVVQESVITVEEEVTKVIEDEANSGEDATDALRDLLGSL